MLSFYGMKHTLLAGSALFLALVLTGQGCPSRQPETSPPSPVAPQPEPRRVKIETGANGAMKVTPSPTPQPEPQPAPDYQY